MDNKRKAIAAVYKGPGSGTPKTKRFKWEKIIYNYNNLT